MDKILEELNQVAGVKGSMVVTKDGVVVSSALGAELGREHGKENVAAISSHFIQVSERGLDDLGRGTFERFALTSAHGRMVFVNLDVGYLVVIIKMEMKVGQVLIEVESAARKIRGLNRRI
jgi:predicted regulator of Ras-like GTPase activity (Roadblock/LC7/MglB family)